MLNINCSYILLEISNYYIFNTLMLSITIKEEYIIFLFLLIISTYQTGFKKFAEKL